MAPISKGWRRPRSGLRLFRFKFLAPCWCVQTGLTLMSEGLEARSKGAAEQIADAAQTSFVAVPTHSSSPRESQHLTSYSLRRL